MTKKVNPQLFRIKNYNSSNSLFVNFFDSLDQYYLIKRNLYFFTKFFRKFQIYIFSFKLQRNSFKIFKIFFFCFFFKTIRYFYFFKRFFGRSKKNKIKKKEVLLKRTSKFKKKSIRYLILEEKFNTMVKKAPARDISSLQGDL